MPDVSFDIAVLVLTSQLRQARTGYNIALCSAKLSDALDDPELAETYRQQAQSMAKDVARLEAEIAVIGRSQEVRE
jgi:hypothetical protein